MKNKVLIIVFIIVFIGFLVLTSIFTNRFTNKKNMNKVNTSDTNKKDFLFV